MNGKLLYGLLIDNPDSDGIGALLKKQLVELALASSTVPLAERQIGTAIARVMDLTSAFPSTGVHQGIEVGLRYGTVENLGSALFRLTPKGVENIDQLSRNLGIREEQFDQYVKSSLPECVKTDEDRSAIAAALKNDLVELLTGRAELLAGSFHKEEIGPLLVEGADGGGFPRLTALIDRIASSEIDRFEIRKYIRDRLSVVSDEAANYLVSLYRRVFYHKMLVLDPEAQRLQLERLSGWHLFLDTNVVIALLVPSHPHHHTIRAILERCGDVGCKMSICGVTKAEFVNQLGVAPRRYERFKKKDPAVQTAVNLKREIFIYDYIRSLPMTRVSFATYLAQFRDVEDLLIDRLVEVREEAGMHVDPDSAEAKALSGVIFSVKQASGMSVREQTVMHDTCCILGLQKLRESGPMSSVGNKVWFLTLDRSLRKAQLRAHLDPCDLQVQELLDLMTVLVLPDLTNLKSSQYAGLLLSSALGDLAPDIAEKVGEFLDAMEAFGMHLRQMPRSTQEAVVTRLALDRQSYEILERFRSSRRREDRDAAQAEMMRLADQYQSEEKRREGQGRQIDALTETLATTEIRARELEEELARRNQDLSRESGKRRVLSYALVGVIVALLSVICALARQ